MQTNIVVIGAGPAGLTAAYLLAKANLQVTVLEADPQYVGGIARTEVYKGFCFDIGGHRFFSKTKEVEDFWQEILPADMLNRPRSSRIFYKGKLFSYPLRAIEALRKLGGKEACQCLFSYIKSCCFPIKNPCSFAEWVSNRFGKRLFNIFFKTYTEKVWGMSCDEISADWAAQRIQGLSLFKTITRAIFNKKSTPKNAIKTLINTFRYPRKGPGMLWEACARKIKSYGGEVLLNSRVTKCEYCAAENHWKISYTNSHNNTVTITATHIISSAPLKELTANYIQPTLSPAAITAANSLKYRDFLIVILILKDKNQFSDNWIYIHDPSVTVARIQNFKSWSPEMVPDPSLCCYGMEYFCNQDDALWSLSNAELLDKAKQEIAQLGLADMNDIIDGTVVRQEKAYPVYDKYYQDNVAIIRTELANNYPTLHLVGRNGMHKYNNQDHAMMTAMLCVKNILAGKNIFDVWQVNQDAEYIESGNISVSGLRSVPEKLDT